MTVITKLLTTVPERKTQTSLDTIIITPEFSQNLKHPSWQRPIKVNTKVMELSERLKTDGGVLPGVLTFGIIGNSTYILDGQHRLKAFEISGLKESYADVRRHVFTGQDAEAEMGLEFIELQGHIVNIRPDDVLRAMEGLNPHLRYIREQCPFVGYDYVRRGPNSPILSMSKLIRAWDISSREVPIPGMGGAKAIAEGLTKEDAINIVRFLNICQKAWGLDFAYRRLWGTLNLTLCMWLYRNIVLFPKGSHKYTTFTHDMFLSAMTALSASGHHLEWLIGRNSNQRDTSPGYARISIIVKRRMATLGTRVKLPQPAWSPAAKSAGATKYLDLKSEFQTPVEEQ